MSLQPSMNEDKVAIPATFDVRTSSIEFKAGKLYLCIFGYIVCVIVAVVLFFILPDMGTKIWLDIALIVGVPLVLRFGVLHERYFRKLSEDLSEHKNTYSPSSFWSVYDITGTYPTLCRYMNGDVAMFVRLNKGVIVGKSDDGAFEHQEAVADALKLMTRRGISCTHIDYMDSVGSDKRVDKLFDSLSECKSETLKYHLSCVYDNMRSYMNLSYASYDVYCFMYHGSESLFVDEMQSVLIAFKKANYRTAEILDRNQIRELVSKLFSLDEFSVTKACDDLVTSTGTVSHMTTLWTEKDGVREQVNKTSTQLAEERRILEQERQTTKAVARRRRQARNWDNEIDLFDTGNATQRQSSLEWQGTSSKTTPTTQTNEGSETDKELNLFS